MIELNDISAEGIDLIETVPPDTISLLKKYFYSQNTIEISYREKIKTVSRFTQFSFPAKLNEFFLDYDDAPLYWICEVPLNLYLKDFYKQYFRGINGVDSFGELKDNYSKWLLIKAEAEKKYYASTVISLVEKSVLKNNFLGLILYGVILTYDTNLSNPIKAISLFDQAKSVLSSIKINKEIKDRLDYLIELFSGYAFLKSKKITNAKEHFINALAVNSGGITAKYHLAFSESHLGNWDSCESLLKELFDTEKDRMRYALSAGSTHQVNFLIGHSIIPGSAKHKEFFPCIESIVQYCETIKDTNERVIHFLKRKLESIDDYKIISEYSGESLTKLQFLNKIIELTEETGHIYLYSCAEFLKEQFVDSIEMVISSIRKRYYGGIPEKLLPLEKEITEYSEQIEQLKVETEEKRSVLKTRLSDTLNAIEQQKSEKIAELKENINGLEENMKYDPLLIFKQTMGYNIILSIIISFMGGCAGYSGSSMSNNTQLKDILASSLLTGIKWGIIVFLAGILISTIAAAFTLLEKAGIKQKLLKRINNLKVQAEKTIKRIKKEAEKQELKIAEDYNTAIIKIKSIIEELTSQKETNENKLKQEAEKYFKEESAFFEMLIN